ARLKFLAREWGAEKLNELVLTERRQIIATHSGLFDLNPENAEDKPRIVAVVPEVHVPSADAFARWKSTNVVPQRQSGWNVISVRCPLGDISPAQLRAVSAIARRHCGGRVRISISQNLLLRWVSDRSLAHVFLALASIGLAESEAGKLADITRCPGADTCQIALTHSRGLAAALSTVVTQQELRVSGVEDVSIKISGCMNSCGQHHIADIGFHGATEISDGHELPVYVMQVGGRTWEGGARFGKIVARVPAALVPEATRSLLEFFREKRQTDEAFPAFVDRIGTPAIRNWLEPYTALPSFAAQPQLFRDLGIDTEFHSEVGVGECAG